jgi:hypothetical protein
MSVSLPVVSYIDKQRGTVFSPFHVLNYVFIYFQRYLVCTHLAQYTYPSYTAQFVHKDITTVIKLECVIALDRMSYE